MTIVRHARLRGPAATTAALAAVGLLAAGCGGTSTSQSDAPSPAATSPSSPSPSAPSPTASSPAAASGLPTAFPDADLHFTHLPTKLDAPARQALRTYFSFEDILRRSLRTKQLPARFATVAAPDLVKRFQESAVYERTHDVRFTGPTRLSISAVKATGRLAAFDVCTDGTDLRQVTKGVPRRLDGLQRVKTRVVVTNEQERWIVTEYTSLNVSC